MSISPPQQDTIEAPETDRSLRETLVRAAEHGERAVLLCSFQKEESVLLDELLNTGNSQGRMVRVATIDTGVLFPETMETWKRFEDHFGIEIERFDASSPGRPWTGGAHCCSTAKVAALEGALAGADAWITGVRREQGPTRELTELVDFDERRGLLKYNPLAFWTEKDLWHRILERGLPYNPLHDQGYDSIGCMPCTQPGRGREGRWADSDQAECGIHL